MQENKLPIPSVIYARVSPTTHIRTATELHQSLEESLRVCKRAAEFDNNPIVAEYIDQYVSGKSSKEMPEFQRMMSDARNGKFRRIYCRRVNRFGRNRVDMIKSEIELSELDITIKFVENGIDTGVQFGKSIMALMSEIAEQDRLEILENTKRGREYAKIHGTRSGKPFGHPKKELNIKLIRQARLAPIAERQSWKKLEETFHASRTIMIQRLKDEGYWDEEKRTVK